MSVTIYNTPDTISTPYRPTYFDCSSDLGTIARMIADVYVNGSLVTTIDKDPLLGETDQFRFEVGDILKKYVTSDFVDITSSLQGFNGLDSANNCYLRVFEVLDNGSTFDTSWTEGGSGTNYAQNSTIYTFNGVNQHQQDLSDYIASSSTSNFLTNRPQYSETPRGKFRIGVLTNETSLRANLILYSGRDGTGTALSNSNSSFITPTNKRATFGCDLSDYTLSAKSFKITLYDAFASAKTKTLIYNIVDSCDNATTLFWQNHWGEFDTYLFGGRKRQKTKTKTTSLKKKLNLSYNSDDRGLTDIEKVNTRSYTIYTKTHNKDVTKWLAEIDESVDVRILKDGEVISINVLSVSSTIEDSERGIYQISVNYVESNQRINQLG